MFPALGRMKREDGEFETELHGEFKARLVYVETASSKRDYMSEMK